MRTVNFYYFENLPILEVRPPAIDKDDPRLADRKHFAHKFQSWKSLYKEDIFENISRQGIIDPLISLYENRRWRVEPGQARWLAAWYLGWKTQNVIFMVRDVDDFTHYLNFNHRQIETEEELYNLFTDSKDREHVGYDYLIKRRNRYIDEPQ